MCTCTLSDWLSVVHTTTLTANYNIMIVCIGMWAQVEGFQYTCRYEFCMWFLVRTIGSLQTCLHSLKEDMSKLHQQMDHHSAAVRSSQRSTRYTIHTGRNLNNIIKHMDLLYYNSVNGYTYNVTRFVDNLNGLALILSCMH